MTVSHEHWARQCLLFSHTLVIMRRLQNIFHTIFHTHAFDEVNENPCESQGPGRRGMRWFGLALFRRSNRSTRRVNIKWVRISYQWYRKLCTITPAAAINRPDGRVVSSRFPLKHLSIDTNYFIDRLTSRHLIEKGFNFNRHLGNRGK